MAEKIQLAVSSTSNAFDNQKVIAQELDSVRKSTGKLPKLADADALNAINKANVKLAAVMEDKNGLPRVSGKVHDKMQATRRGAALMHALGKTEVERQMAKEEQEKKKRKARLEKASQGASGRHNGHDKGAPGGPLSRSSTHTRGQDGKSGAQSGPVTGRSHVSGRSKDAYGRRSNAQGQGRTRGAMRRRHSPHGEEPHGVREDSRVGRLIAEFGGRDDWVSSTVLKHQMASIIQANVRGWLVRLKWWANPDYVVDTLHAKLHAQATEAERRAKLRKELEVRSLSSKQKKLAGSAVSKLFGPKHAGPGGAAGFAARGKSAKWGKLQKNADIAVQEIKQDVKESDKYTQLGLDPRLADMLGSDPDSEFSDLEMEDITAVKLRAKTPPWQKQEESQWAGQYSKLIRAAAHSSLNMKWDLDECQDRLEACRARHRRRNPEQAEEEAKEYDLVAEPLPPDVVSSLLYPKYRERMVRLGLMKASEWSQQDDGKEQMPVQEMFPDASKNEPPTLVLPSLNVD